MNKVDYLHQDMTESLFVEKEVEMEAFGVHQRDDVVFNQTDGKKNDRLMSFTAGRTKHRLTVSLASQS